MAGRKNKNTVDYFPHYCISGKTLFIIENKFGNVGYTVWFKTLELLGRSENHYIDLRDETDLLYLISKLKVSEIEFKNIYDLFAKLGAIDPFLWSKKIIFSENFIKNIEDVYKRRGNNCMHKSDLCKHLSIKLTHKLNNSKQESTKESKVKESKVKEIYRESKYFDLDMIKKDIGDKYLKYDLDFYRESVLNWSDSKNEKKIDWLATFRNFILRDIKEGKGKMNSNNMVY